MMFATRMRAYCALVRCYSASNMRLKSTMARPVIPEIYPAVLALPVSKKPLFPHVHKAFTVRDPEVCKALERLVEAGQPYIGTFLTKDDDSVSDTVQSIDEVYRIGTFAQIVKIERTPASSSSSSSSSTGSSTEGIGELAGDGASTSSSTTVTLLPHRRIRIRELFNPSRLTVAPPLQSPLLQNGTATGSGDRNPDGGTNYPGSDLLADYNISCALVDNLYDEPTNRRNPVVKAITSELLSVMKELIKHDNSIKDQIAFFTYSAGVPLTDNPSVLADFAASLVAFGEPAELQSILESLVIEERMQKALFILKKELANAKLQYDINMEVEKKMDKAKKEYYLLEHMKGIQKELGMESDGRDKLVQQFRDKARQLSMPKAVKSVFDEELLKFRNLEPSAGEFSVSRNYLDWLTQLPWGKLSKENFDISYARSVLDQDHYGMRDVKDRILEFIAVGKLRNSVQGKILCLSGPPGVGKTSIAKSVAKSLGREFYRFSVGGLNDVSEIKGHRRTYVGAMPGKLVQALKSVQTENPVILMDEIDKIGTSSYRGDPSSALLEALDAEQNQAFTDHYLDVSIDLSKVLFMCTANMLDTIPGPLLDRMEVIELSGYVAEEKKAIAERYLMPNARQAAGLGAEQVNIDQQVLDLLLRSYCRESGVRSLKKHLEKIYRKAALKLVRSNSNSSSSSSSTNQNRVEVTTDNLREFVGNPLFVSDRLYSQPQAGVISGLAWTGLGGTTLDFEAIVQSSMDEQDSDASRPSLIRTGQLGDVMKESTNIAYTYAKHFLVEHQPDSQFFQRNSIHLHVPEGAIPKDGPSAGITICTSLLSLAMGRTPVMDVAMTGELTLTGLVLKIGGVKEKIMAAKRSGFANVILPAANRPDYEDLEPYVKAGLQVHFVETYEDVAKLVFG